MGALLVTVLMLAAVWGRSGFNNQFITIGAVGSAITIGVLSLAAFRVAAPQPSRESEAEGNVGFEQTIVGTAELDSRGVIVAVNSAMSSQTGYARDHLIGQSLVAVSHPMDRSRHMNAIEQLLCGEKKEVQFEHRYQRPDNTEIWVSEHMHRVGEAHEARIMVQSQDITYRRQATWELARQALHDELTGLPNRAMLLYRLRAALQTSNTDNAIIGVMFIDVDRFKVVNDSLGHEVGDQLIKFIGKNIGTAIRHGDTVSRFGGDEFVVLCPELSGKSEAVAVAERIRRAVAQPFEHGGNKIHPTLSIGISTCDPHASTADELLRDSDAAMYRAKERGRNRIEFFDDSMRDKLVQRMELESELRTAIRDESLSMYYQSIVELESGQPVGFESLIRWVHPTRGLLSPGQFLPTAEEAGLQSNLDTVALRKTARQLADWAAMFPAAQHLYVSSNIVPKNFKQFVNRIDDALRSSGLPPDRLLVEVVENALLDDADGSLSAIQALKEMGVSIAIDDFGTGYSSLSYLTQFKPDKLKIDRSFVSRLPDDRATAAIIRAIAGMADALDITVIAEGVETIQQAEALHSFGIPLGQGFLYAKPRSPEEITDWFESNHIKPDVIPAPAPFRAFNSANYHSNMSGT